MGGAARGLLLSVLGVFTAGDGIGGWRWRGGVGVRSTGLVGGGGGEVGGR